MKGALVRTKKLSLVRNRIGNTKVLMGKLGPNVETQVPLKPLWFITVGFHIELNFN